MLTPPCFLPVTLFALDIFRRIKPQWSKFQFQLVTLHDMENSVINWSWPESSYKYNVESTCLAATANQGQLTRYLVAKTSNMKENSPAWLTDLMFPVDFMHENTLLLGPPVFPHPALDGDRSRVSRCQRPNRSENKKSIVVMGKHFSSCSHRTHSGLVKITASGLRNTRCWGCSADVCVCVCLLYIHEPEMVTIWNFCLGLF